MAKKPVKSTNKPADKKAKKPSELDSVILADGKKLEDPDITKVKQLEEILGIKRMNPFGTTNIEIFQERLSEMTNVDLQHLCERVGIFASGSRQELKQKLLREFKATNKGSISMTIENPAVKLDPNNPKHKKTLKILGEI
jgi:hypothetical protein